MRVGIVILPDARWPEASAKWRQAEQYGFAHLWTYDHIGWLDYVDGPWFGAVPTLTAAALVTSTVELGLLVATPNFRHPVPFMRELLALDDVARGRFVLGLGAGDDGYDARVLGDAPLTPRRRADRFGEFVEALDGLLTTDRFDHAGEFFRAHGARNLPGPVRRPRMPFVVAANGPRGMRLAAARGEGWITTGRPAATQDAWWASVADLAARFDAVAPGRTLRRFLNLEMAPQYALASVEAFRESMGRAAALGFTDAVIRWPRAGASARRYEAVLEQVAADALPEVQAASRASERPVG